MRTVAIGVSKKQIGTISVFWFLIALYMASRILQVYPGKVPMLAVVALHVLPPAIFAGIHGAYLYRLRGILVFLITCFVIGNVFENLGVRTGFPFGHYYFTGLMGPKLLVVPVLLGMAYMGMAYLSWTLANLILGEMQHALIGPRVVTLPLIASCIMVAWDFSMDPVWSTILHAWIWLRGGSYFGVPVSNFLGWYLTVYVFYQLFALYLKDRSTAVQFLPRGFWHTAVLFYAVSAMGNVLLAFHRSGAAVVYDAVGTSWRVSAITDTCALVSIFLMGAFALIAEVRLTEQQAKAAEVVLRRGRNGSNQPPALPKPPGDVSEEVMAKL